MRIAIDARMMSPLTSRGIGRYIEELVRAMVSAQTGHAFILLVREPDQSPFLGLANVEHLTADVPWYGLAEQLTMPHLFRSAKADLIHVPHWNVPLAMPSRLPLVITLHDLLLRHQPQSAKASTRHPLISAAKRFGYRVTLERAVARSRAILVPTQFVAGEAVHYYPSAAGRLAVTGEGLTALPAPDFRRVPDHPFLFYVGSAYPHKRLDLLLDVWKDVAVRHAELHLVIAGEEDLFMARHVARVEREQLPRVSFTGRVSDAELAGFLDRAAAFVFPSSHEGFGLPPLEALAHGCPVVSSDAASLPEVLPKQGVFFFRNGDRDGMMRALETLLDDRAAAKHSAQAVAPSIPRLHDWKRVAEQTLEAYERVVKI